MYKLKSCYMPYRVPGCYTQNIKSFLNQYGIETVSIRECLKKPKVFSECKIFNLNWFENIHQKSKIGAWGEYFYKTVFILILKFFNKKIIYTLHNKEPHSGWQSNISKRIMKMVVKRADTVIIMCEESRNVLTQLGLKDFGKVEKIRHPSFIQNYVEEYCESGSSEVVVLFFGTIQPYKNIELLINVFSKRKNENIRLWIAGNPVSKEYENTIKILVHEKENIKAILRFIREDEIPDLFAKADIAILPYDYQSSLNSGAVYLSFSLSRTVICPDIGTITELKDKSFIYNYTYQNEAEHIRKLNVILDKIQKDGKEQLRKYGSMAKQYLITEHSDHEIAEQYARLYFKLVQEK